MGCSNTKQIVINDEYDSVSVVYDDDLINIASHFIPSHFPLEPNVDMQYTMKHVKDAWDIIKNSETLAPDESSDALTFFFDNFYESLYQRNELFRDRWPMRTKARILVSVMDFITTLIPNDPASDKRIEALATKHNFLRIRPALYSIYMDNLLTSIAFTLGKEATSARMEAFSNVFSYFLYKFIHVAIQGLINPHEATHQTFGNHLSEDQIEEVKQRQEFRKQVRDSTIRSSTKSQSEISGYSTNKTPKWSPGNMGTSFSQKFSFTQLDEIKEESEGNSREY